MPTPILNRALILLIGLSLVTTVFAGVLPEAGPVFVLTVLVLSGSEIARDPIGLLRSARRPQLSGRLYSVSDRVSGARGATLCLAHGNVTSLDDDQGWSADCLLPMGLNLTGVSS